MGDDLEKCVICLSLRKCAHTRQHPCKATPKQLCGPWAICVKCSDLVCQKSVAGSKTAVSGQFGCPICKSELGPRRRALEEGMEVAEWEVEPDTPADAWKMPVDSETQLAMHERNLPELRRLLDVKLPAEISAPVRAFMAARPELAAPPTPSTQRQRWAAVLSRLGIAAGQQKANQSLCAGESSQTHPGAASASSGQQSVAESDSAPLAPRSAAGHRADAGGSLSDHYFGSSSPGTEEGEALQSVGVLPAATRAVEAVSEKEAIEKARFEKAVAAAMAEKLTAATAKAGAEKAAAEKAAWAKAEQEKAATVKRRADRAAAENLAAETAATEKRRAERTIAEKAAEKAATEKRRAERAVAEKAAAGKAAAEKAEKAATDKRRAERAVAGMAASEKAAAETEIADKMAAAAEKMAAAAEKMAALEKAAVQRAEFGNAASENAAVEEEARVQVEAEHRLRSEEHERLRLEPERQLREEEQERLRKEMEQVLKSAQRRKDERLLLEEKQQRQEDGRRRLVAELAPQALGRRRAPPETPAQACRGLDDATLSRCPDGLLRSFFAEYVRDDSDCILLDDKSNRHRASSSLGSGAVPTRRPDQDAQLEKASARLDAEIATIRHAETARRRSSSAAAAERARFQSEQHAGLRLEGERQREQERLEQLEKEKRSQWKAVQLQERQRREADAERHQLEAERRQEVEHRQRDADRRRLKEEEVRLKMKAELRQREEEKERILVAAERRRRKDEEAQFQMDIDRQRRDNEQERLRLEQERRQQEKEKEQTLKEARERETEKLYWLDVARREMDQVRLREGDGQKQALELKRQQLKDEERRVAEKRRLLDAQEQMLQQKRQRLQKEGGVKQLGRSREASPIRTVTEGTRPVHTPVRASRPRVEADASHSECPDHVVHAVLSAHNSPGVEAVETAAGASAHDQPAVEAPQIMRTRPTDDVKGRQQIQGHSAAVSSKRCDVETVLDEVKQRRPLLAASGKMGQSTVPSLSPAMKDGALLSRIKDRMHSATKENLGANSCAPATSSSSRFISHPAVHDTKKPLPPCGQKRRRDVEASARKTARTEPLPTPVGSGIFEDNGVFSPVGTAAVKTGPPPAVVHASLPASELVPLRSKVATATAAKTAPAIEKRRQAPGAVPTMSSMLAAFDALQKKPTAKMDKFPRR